MDRPCKPYYISLQGSGPYSETVCFEGKAWLYEHGDGPCLMWELRRFIQAYFAPDKQKVEPSTLVKRYRLGWFSLFDTLGWSPELVWRDSARRMQSVAKEDDADEKTRGEYSCDSRAMLAIFIYWSGTRKTLAQQGRAEAMIGALLHHLPARRLDIGSVAPFAEKAAPLCEKREPPYQQCLCLETALRRLPSLATFGDPKRHCIVVLRRLLLDATKCKAIAGTVARMIETFAELIALTLPVVAQANPLKSTKVSCKGQKRSRADEDVKHAVVHEMVCKRAVPSGSTAIAMDEDLKGANHSQWVHESLMKYRSAVWAAFGTPLGGVYACAEDGTRLGRPAKEMQCYAFWSHRADQATWLAPQAPNWRGKFALGGGGIGCIFSGCTQLHATVP